MRLEGTATEAGRVTEVDVGGELVRVFASEDGVDVGMCGANYVQVDVE